MGPQHPLSCQGKQAIGNQPGPRHTALRVVEDREHLVPETLTKVIGMESNHSEVNQSEHQALLGLADCRRSLASRTTSSRRDTSADRSEEHTSELQSLTNLVCRLLL